MGGKVWKSLGCVRLPGLYGPRNSPGQNTAVGSLSLLQGIFPTQGSNPGLPHCRLILYHRSHRGKPSGRVGEFSGIELLGVLLGRGLKISSGLASTSHWLRNLGASPRAVGGIQPRDHTPRHPLHHPGQLGRPWDRVSHQKMVEARLAPAVPSPPPRPQKRP